MHEKCDDRVPVGDSVLGGLSQPARISCSSGGSMLPPDRIITVRPGGVVPLRYAASATAPLGSADQMRPICKFAHG